MNDKQLLPLSDEDVAHILQDIEDDTAYLGECYLELQMLLQNNYMQILCKGNKARVPINFFVHPQSKKCCFEYRRKAYIYMPQMFKTVIEDVILAMNRNRAYFSLDREFVRCSLQKMRRN